MVKIVLNLLGTEPTIDPTAVVIDSELGEWTKVGARTSITETAMGDYSYVENDADIIYSRIGKFCSIAAFARINPGNHPLYYRCRCSNQTDSREIFT